MGLRTRLEHLERRQPNKSQLTFSEFLDRHCRLYAWLAERGFADALAAVEAGESGPVGLVNILREQAGHDYKRRVFARIEKALDEGQLPDEADLRIRRDVSPPRARHVAD
jgi:hypothetical protein